MAYGSRRLSATEQNYRSTRRKLLVAVEFISHFRHYHLGRPFTLRTDHSSLQSLKEPESRLARWLEKLDFQMIHRSGRHQNADALSRRLCHESCLCTVLETNLGVHCRQRAMQCSLDDVPVEEVTMVTFTEQPPVGVVDPDECCGGCLTSKPEFPPVGVEDTSSDDHCGYAHTRPSIHRVSEPPHTYLFCGWTQEQLNNGQLTDPDIAPAQALPFQGPAGH